MVAQLSLMWMGLYLWPLTVYLAFAIPAFVALRSRELDEVSKALWALVIAIPIAGAVGFAIVQPGRRA